MQRDTPARSCLEGEICRTHKVDTWLPLAEERATLISISHDGDLWLSDAER
jgi:hypothetical protein